MFGKALNVSAETVRSWEQEKRVPEGAALLWRRVRYASRGRIGGVATPMSGSPYT